MPSAQETSGKAPVPGRSLPAPAIVVAAVVVVVVIALVLVLGGDDLSIPFGPDDDGDNPPVPPVSWDVDTDGDGMSDVWELHWKDPGSSRPALDPNDPSDMFEDPDDDGYDHDQSGLIERYQDMLVPSRLGLRTSIDYVEVNLDELLGDPSGFDGMPVLIRNVVVMDAEGLRDDDACWFGDEVEARVAEAVTRPEALWVTVRLEAWSNHPMTLDVHDDPGAGDANASERVNIQGIVRSSEGNLTIVVRGGEAFTNVMEFQSMYYTGEPSLPLNKRDLDMYNKTSPLSADTDGDGMCDGWEAWYGDRDKDPATGEDRWSVLDPTSPIDAREDPDRDCIETRWQLVRWLWVDADGDGNLEPPDGHSPIDPVTVGLNIHEYIVGTNPRVADTDGDSYPLDSGNTNDFDELIFHGTDPVRRDTDGDRVPDGYEIYYNLDPIGPQDGAEDPDEDDLTNSDEYRHDLHPYKPDTDGDQMPDGWEVYYWMDPKDPSDGRGDADEDRLLNVFEYLNGTNPWFGDTDGDGLTDYEEVVVGWTVVVDGASRRFFTDPTSVDTDMDDREDDEDGDGNTDPCEELLDGIDNDGDRDILQNNGIDDDGDGIVDDGRAGIPAVGQPEGVDEECDLNDWNEVHVFRTNASHPDTDGDGLDDWREWFTDLDEASDGVQRTQPTLSDTDGDELDDGQEVDGVDLWLPGFTDMVRRMTDPLAPDSDYDGLPDGYEVLVDLIPATQSRVNSTDPTREDTDGDGMPDAYELEFSDIDGDGLPTGWERRFCGIYPGMELKRDCDGDGVLDPFEDWDVDGLDNLHEYMWRCDPWNGDTDGDGVGDLADLEGTPRHLRPLPRQPVFSDIDGDLMPDWWEVMHDLDPLSASDMWYDYDADLLTNLDEYIYDLDPRSSNTDGDEEMDIFDHEIMASLDAYDSDGDGIADWWERMYSDVLDFANPGDAALDPDGDGLSNLDEWTFAADPFNHVPTDPTKADTDGDGRLDSNDPYPVWINTTTRPLNPDRGCAPLHPLMAHLKDGRPQAAMDMDRDGLNNSHERTVALGPTDPMDPDTDADGMPDGWEVVHAVWDPMTGEPNLSPLDPSDRFLDPDWDGVNYQFKRDQSGNWIIRQMDTNGDGYPDPSFENETFCNLEEYLFGEDLDRDGINERTSHPNKWDTDGDDMCDGFEVLFNDRDGDAMSTMFELVYGLDPLSAEGDDGADGDPDGDGWSNLEEFLAGTDPTDPESP